MKVLVLRIRNINYLFLPDASPPLSAKLIASNENLVFEKNKYFRISVNNEFTW